MAKLDEPVGGLIIILFHCLTITKYLVIPEYKTYTCIYSFKVKLFHFNMLVTGQTYLGTSV